MIVQQLLGFLKNLEFKKKFGLMLCLAVLLVGSISLAVAFHILHRYDHILYQMSAAVSSSVQSDIDSQLDIIASYTGLILGNGQVQSDLTILNDSEDRIACNQARNDLYHFLNYYLFTNPYIESITLEVKGSPIHLGSPKRIEPERLIQLQKAASEQQGRYFWTAAGNAEGQIYCVREIREKAYVTMRPLATLYIRIDFDRLLKDTRERNGNLNDIVILDQQQVLAPAGDPNYRIYQDLPDLKSPYSIREINGKKQLITYGTLYATSWAYINLINYDSIFQGIRSLKILYVGLIITASLVILSLTNLLVGRILKQFHILVGKMKRFEQGRLEELPAVSDSTEPLDEVGVLNRTFDEMAAGFRQLVNDNYIKQLHLKDAQLKMLRQQINPHFLYNTLDSINWLAQKYQADDISTMARSLGTLFRGTVSDTQDFITLKEELVFLDSYLSIQSIRFREQLIYSINIPEQYHSLVVPRMMLQPLLENAIRHGLEDSLELCRIEVSLDETKDCCRILVANSGSFFDPDLLVKLQNQEITPAGTGVGLVNINTRLCLLYGEAYHLQFKNCNHMATAIIKIPREKER